ncbi:MAG TPA: DUF1553 domain-containing protein [Isosphaeraceae bacterium]|jgi:hypothetical protein|nr:DUF1553 domain-containing protein [Isosphaeraceae bacterium]
MIRLTLSGILAAWLLAGSALAGPPQAQVDYSREIRPILAKNCFACHGGDEKQRQKGLRLDRRDVAVQELADGAKAIVPGAPEDSDLYFRITEEDDTLRMPPKKAGAPLKPTEIDLIRRWIEQGAPYSEHWAFIPPVARPLPEVKDRSWTRNGVDAWILARLEQEDLKPAPEADRYTLLRRVSLDLRGLPPTPEEVEAFINDKTPEAYEKAVDQFLADPAYGERWARMWLDLARYADSAGYGSDPLRTIWRYRDWVIDAFNRNMPYDRFTIVQIAGDLLPNPTLEDRMATAFHRNTMTNTEGGTDDEEFRVAAIKDRVDTTGQVWMGLTIGCAKCHSHKFDPISHEEYYRFFAFFNQTADSDREDEQPVIPAPTPAIREEVEKLDAQIAELKKKLDVPTPELAEAQAKWQVELAKKPEWVVLEPQTARSEQGAWLEILADNSVRASGKNPERDTYTLTSQCGVKGITGFRLEALPDPSFPGSGAGRASDGNFVLSRFAAEIAPTDAKPQSSVGRFVRIELPGEGRFLSLAEVEVFRGPENLARGASASQSSTDFGGDPARAIDGNSDGNYNTASSTTHTRADTNPWWELKLAEPAAIERIVVWNRTDNGLGTRLVNFHVKVLDDNRKVVWETTVAEPPDPKAELSLGGPLAVSLTRASADFVQEGFTSADLLKKADAAKGWAVAPRQAEPHEAIFAAKEASGIEGPCLVTVRLEHRYKDAGYNLGRFRISVTNDPNLSKRAEQPPAIIAIIDTPDDRRTLEQRDALARHYRSIAPALQGLRDEVKRLESSRPSVPTLPVMVELPADKRRETHLLNKGNFLDPGQKLEPGVPSAFPPLPEGAPQNRLGLAQWLVDPKNPMTARVAMNRFWAQLFGTGLVETEEDFGTQGDPPTHPELLDWLACEAIRLGWDTKAILKLLVTSATYRQSSRVTPELVSKDPRNRLLARAPRLRLEAEMVRDQALALSGLLSRKVGGPSVFPPQPDGLWQAAFNGQRTWSTSKGDDRYRRALYTFWRRTIPYPSMATFDAPSREICTLRRIRTNTPLQAFVTLNDPVYVEAAQALARRIVREGGSTVEDRARFGLRLCLGRPPEDDEVNVLKDLFEREQAHFRDHRDDARALATEPLGPLPAEMDPADLASWTTVANILLNLDGVLTKG